MKTTKTILSLKGKVSDALYKRLTTEKVLQLTLTKKWFNMIASGLKKEEYRENKPYWAKRLLYKNIIGGFAAKQFDLILFKNGYGNNPILVVESNGLGYNEGLEEWGGEINKLCFVIRLGLVLYGHPRATAI